MKLSDIKELDQLQRTRTKIKDALDEAERADREHAVFFVSTGKHGRQRWEIPLSHFFEDHNKELVDEIKRFLNHRLMETDALIMSYGVDPHS